MDIIVIQEAEILNIWLEKIIQWLYSLTKNY